jgi:hypothetical protein
VTSDTNLFAAHLEDTICPEQRSIPVLFCSSVAPATVDSVDSQPVTGFTTGGCLGAPGLPYA